MRVFLDANVIIRGGKPPGGPQITQLHELVEARFISIMTTDHTILEVAKRHVRNEYDVLKVIAHRRLQDLAKARFKIELPALTDHDIRESLWQEYETSTRRMFRRLGAEILPIDDVPPSQILTTYARNEGFFAKNVKKDQFPDAFIFARLQVTATQERPITIICDDGDFDEPSNSSDHFVLVKSIPALLQLLGLDGEAPDPEPFLDVKSDEIQKIVGDELGDWGLDANDVEDAYIEVTGTESVELDDLISYGTVAKNGTVLVIGTAKIVANVEYTHPSWDNAIWDFEDKVLIPFENVSGETTVEIQADFSMSILVNDDGDLAQITEFRFRNENFLGVELYPQEY